VQNVSRETEGKILFSRQRYKWKDNMTMELALIRSEEVEWIQLADNGVEYRLSECYKKPLGSHKSDEFLYQVNNYRL
jgi:hypothetical protein